MTHQTEAILLNYLHGALTTDEREAFEQRLLSDAVLRARLRELRQVQRGIEGGLSAEISTQSPPPTMTFDAIMPQVARSRPVHRQAWGQRWLSAVTALAAMMVLVFAVFYSLDGTNDSNGEGSGVTDFQEPTATTSALDVVTPTAINDIDFEGELSVPTRTPSPDPFNSLPTRTPSPTSSPEPESNHFRDSTFEKGGISGTTLIKNLTY